MQHDGEPHCPEGNVPPAQASGAAQDVWLALELFVERVARLVLHAYALAERMDQQDSTPGREGRQARLARCIEVGRRVLQAVARLDMAEPSVARPHDDVADGGSGAGAAHRPAALVEPGPGATGPVAAIRRGVGRGPGPQLGGVSSDLYRALGDGQVDGSSA